MLSYASGLVTYENVVFHKTNEIYTNNAQWTITFVHDLRPYEIFIERINKDLESTHDITSSITNYYRRTNQTGFVYTFESLHEEIAMLNNTLKSITNKFDDYKSLKSGNNRHKRSLLPIVGKAMHWIFGVITETDLDNINRNLNDLAENQESIIHNLEQSLTILNLTRVQVQENRRAILDLIVCIQKLDSKIIALQEVFQKRFERLEQFINTYLQFKLILDEIRQTSLNAMMYLENLKTELNMLSLNHLSASTISPGELRTLLLDIRDRIPATLMLAVDPIKDIWYYYNTLSCTTYLDGNKILIILTLPLLDNKDKYEIYKIHNLPISLRNATIEGRKTINMIAKYELESRALMINSDRTKYSLLTFEDYIACNNKYMKFCYIKNAIYQINLSKSCIIALFMKHKENVKQYCKATVYIDTKLPIARAIHSGAWIISTSEKLRLTVVCQDKKGQDDITVNPPFGVINLNISCRASNDYLSLPPYYENEINVHVSDSVETLLKLGHVSKFTMWNELNETSTNNITSIEIPVELSNLKEIPMTTFVRYIRNYRKVKVDQHDMSAWTYLIILSALFVVGIIIFCYCKRFRNKKRLASCCSDECIVFGSSRIGRSVSSKVDEDVDNSPGRQVTSTPDQKEALTFASWINESRRKDTN